VGRAELYAALFFLLACILYLKGSAWTGWRRGSRLVGLGFLYLLSMGAKEIGVTLPVVLLLLEVFRPGLEAEGVLRTGREGGHQATSVPTVLSRLRWEGGTYLLLLVVLVAYLGQRASVLGTLTGEVAAPVLRALTPGQQFLTALSLWGQYLRLLLVPFDLSADYAPGVLFPSETLNPGVFLGVVVLSGLGFAIFKAVRSSPRRDLVGAGILWFFLVVLPVSNLLFPTGVLLAERTLYLPSVGFSLVLAGLAKELSGVKLATRRFAAVLAALAVAGLGVRTVVRNPAWIDTYTVLETLNREHPESHLAFLNRGIGMERVGDLAGARGEFDMAVRLAPERYGTLTAAAGYYGRVEDWAQAERLLDRAIAMAPGRDDAYRLLAVHLLRQGLGREAHRVAVSGLANAGFHPELWGSVSESYLLKGDLQAALRARRAALSADPASTHHWGRLADILEALGRDPEAETARRKAQGGGGGAKGNDVPDSADAESPAKKPQHPSHEGSST
jgi:tetratricopeptide (TPR) repeat protein